jgi:carbon starvation protein
MIAIVVVIAMIVLSVAYRFYGPFLVRQLGLNDAQPTPAREINDGIDFVPARPRLLLGQHFSAIAAAGPIVGPILAGLYFGWLPAFLWIIVGAIFIGGVHDTTSLIASVRHKASSIGQIVRQYMSPTAQALFLAFVWLALIYVIVAFTDVTAQTFKATSELVPNLGPGVAMSSLLYLTLGVGMGIALYKFKVNLTIATVVCLPLLFAIIWLGPRMPQPWLDAAASLSTKHWDMLILGYCFVASLVPMWLLLQPRGYLGGWFLYLTIFAGLAGALFGGYTIQYPALYLNGFHSALPGKESMMIFPILFITVACGACSGFHSIVCSGTTSKQLDKESDAKVLGYGAMLLEALVAVLALSTVMMLAPNDAMTGQDPSLVYANGLAKFMGMFGINYGVALAFALLAFSTFVYDTLDVCTRLARYVLQEIFGWKSQFQAIVATVITLSLPAGILLATESGSYKIAWQIFGTSNQLLASLTLLAVSVWLKKTGKNAWYTIAPMIFMMTMSMWSLVLHFKPFIIFLLQPSAGTFGAQLAISGVVGVVLFVLTVFLIVEAINVLVLRDRRAARGTA